MDSRFSQWASIQSDEDLRNSIENRGKLLPETVEAAITELEHRGNEFSAEELQVINDDLQAQRVNATQFNIVLNNTYKNNVVEDTMAPLLYSRRAIYFFTLILGPFFGSILLAINISKVKNVNSIIPLFLFSGVMLAIRVIIDKYTNIGTSYTILSAFITASFLDYFFWRHYLGNVFYRARSIKVPLIIGVFLAAMILLAVITGS
jgi:hypothetical protein